MITSMVDSLRLIDLMIGLIIADTLDFEMLKGFCDGRTDRRTDGLTDRQTFAILESLSRLKIVLLYKY